MAISGPGTPARLLRSQEACRGSPVRWIAGFGSFSSSAIPLFDLPAFFAYSPRHNNGHTAPQQEILGHAALVPSPNPF